MKPILATLAVAVAVLAGALPAAAQRGRAELALMLNRAQPMSPNYNPDQQRQYHARRTSPTRAVVIWQWAQVDAQCQQTAQPRVWTEPSPRHGQMMAIPTSFRWTGPLPAAIPRACGGRQLNGVLVYYVPHSNLPRNRAVIDEFYLQHGQPGTRGHRHIRYRITIDPSLTGAASANP